MGLFMMNILVVKTKKALINCKLQTGKWKRIESSSRKEKEIGNDDWDWVVGVGPKVDDSRYGIDV